MIRLADNYVIDVDSYNYTLKRRRPGVHKKTGEPTIVETTIGYYPSLTAALEGAKNHRVREILAQDSYSLTEAIRVIETVNAEFKKFLSETIEE